MKFCGQSHLHTYGCKRAQRSSGTRENWTVSPVASPRATPQEIQLLDGPLKSKSGFQRDPCCVCTYTCILFPSRRLLSWKRTLVVLVSAVCSACVNLCDQHKYVCGVGCVYICAWWEYMLSLASGETWKHRALLTTTLCNPWQKLWYFTFREVKFPQQEWDFATDFF